MPVPTKHEIEIIPATDMPTIVYVSAPPDLLSVGVGGRMDGIDGIDGNDGDKEKSIEVEHKKSF